MKPHKHAELIKAWADGAEIELAIRTDNGGCEWIDTDPAWDVDCIYRIKPEPKPDVVNYLMRENNNTWIQFENNDCDYFGDNKRGYLKLTFDGETGELKSAEVLK